RRPLYRRPLLLALSPARARGRGDRRGGRDPGLRPFRIDRNLGLRHTRRRPVRRAAGPGFAPSPPLSWARRADDAYRDDHRLGLAPDAVCHPRRYWVRRGTWTPLRPKILLNITSCPNRTFAIAMTTPSDDKTPNAPARSQGPIRATVVGALAVAFAAAAGLVV